jgi:phage terminase large subunit-like protein
VGNAEGKRIIRQAYVEIPRKNGKSELAAAISLFLLFADGEVGAEIYVAAGDRDQASLVFNVAAQMGGKIRPFRQTAR